MTFEETNNNDIKLALYTWYCFDQVSVTNEDQKRNFFLYRNGTMATYGAFCDLVWSDPEEVESWMVSPRGAGWLFGAKITHEFMTLNSLKLICRAHQLVHEGFKYMFDDKLVTVWSAPNYCYRCGNIASILEFTSTDSREPKLFNAVPDSERVIPPRTTTPYFL